MALPTDSSETFIREVEENYRRDRLENFAKKYGTWIAAALVLFLAAIAGWFYWQERSRQQSAEETEQLNAIFTDIGERRLQNVPQRLQALENAKSDAIRASAKLTQAALALERNDRAAAITEYRELSGDEGLPEAYRNLATIRLTALEFDSLRPEQVIARLQPLAQPGNPWFGSAGEMTAMAYLKQGQRAQAARLFAAIAADPQVPQSLRSRAVQIAGSLGVDASASLPAVQQQD